MAAGQGFKTFTTGEVLTAGDVNGYLMQGINVFTNATARDAAITAPAEGQFAFTKDNNSLWYYDGAAWVASGATGDIEGVTAGVGISGGGTSGTVTVTNSMATAIDAKGDLVPGTGADTFARLGVGANGTVLTADSAEATGLKWASAAGGAGMTLISTTSLSGTSTTISGFASTYTNLVLFIYGVVNATDNVKMRIAPNGTTNNFSYVRTSYLQTGSSAATAGAVGGYVMLNSAANKLNTSSQNIFGATFSQYANANSYKGIQGFANYQDGSSTDALEIFSGYFETNTAITSLVITNDGGYSFSAGTALLYGV